MSEGTPRDAGAASVLVGGRYRLLSELGSGGSAHVHRALEESSGRQVALKLLGESEALDPAQRAMFENEYHALLELSHPNIVRAYEYGVDAGRPFYTMELLEGQDLYALTERRTLEAREVCLLLRDVGSALALMHSRRLVHRDVSPRNVFRTLEGRAKLLDFGTLAAAGAHRRVAGTPPFVPPEALHAQPLDARVDLYALGALGYYLLGGTHAYPARIVLDLWQLFRRPPARLHQLAPHAPAALCDLVMALLNLDPRGRPASAAEVVERLTAIGELPREDLRPIADAYLSRPRLVGRETAAAMLRKLLMQAASGRGTAVMVRGAAGLGRSRMLASLEVEAKWMGASSVAIDVHAVPPGPLSVAQALDDAILSQARQEAEAPDAHDPRAGSTRPARRTRQLTEELLDRLDRFCEEQVVVVTIDDVQHADQSSLAVLAQIAAGAPSARLLLVMSCPDEALVSPPQVLTELLRQAHEVKLDPLSASETHQLLRSLFGATPELPEAAQFVHELSRGNPATCMLYAQHMVDRGLARYENARWALPARLREHGLPLSLHAMLKERIASLSGDARALGLGLALNFDDTRPISQGPSHIRLEDYPKLIEADAQRAFAAVAELARAGLVEQREGFYVLAQSALVGAFVESAGDAEHRRSYGRLARIYREGEYGDRLLMLRHLQRAGEHALAIQLQCERMEQERGSRYDWSQARLAVATEVFRTALDYFESHGGSPRQGVWLRRLVLLTGSVYDWSVVAYGTAQIERLLRDSGLGRELERNPDAFTPARIEQAMHDAAVLHAEQAPSERGLSPDEAVLELAMTAWLLTAAHYQLGDTDEIERLTKLIAPLRCVSSAVDAVVEFCEVTLLRAQGQAVRPRARAATRKMVQQAELPDVFRSGSAGVLAHAMAVEDMRRGRPSAVAAADQVGTQLGPQVWMATHSRWLGHAFSGHSTRAAALKQRVELVTEDDLWRRHAFLYVEVELYALTGDLMELRRAAETIAQVAKRFEAWQPWADWAHAEQARAIGDFAAAALLCERAMARTPPGRHRAYALIATTRAEALLAAGATERAREAARELCREARAHELDPLGLVHGLRLQALSSSLLSEPDTALESLASAFAYGEQIELAGLPLALLHEARARIALDAVDLPAAGAALARMGSLLTDAEAPALLQRYQALCERASLPVELPSREPSKPTEPAPPPAFARHDIGERLAAALDAGSRARVALSLLLEEANARSGLLFLVDERGPALCAAIAESYPSAELSRAVERYVQRHAAALSSDSSAITVTESLDADLALLVEGNVALLPILFSKAGAREIVGVAALGASEQSRNRLRLPSSELLVLLGRTLAQLGGER